MVSTFPSPALQNSICLKKNPKNSGFLQVLRHPMAQKRDSVCTEKEEQECQQQQDVEHIDLHMLSKLVHVRTVPFKTEFP